MTLEMTPGPTYLKENQIAALRRMMERVTGLNDKPSLFLLTKSKQERQRFIRDSKFKGRELLLSQPDIEELQARNFIKMLSEKDLEFALTLKSILLMEYQIYEVDEHLDLMLNEISKAVFDKAIGKSGRPLSALHKALVLGLLGLGAISEQRLLNVTEENGPYVRDAVDRAVAFLQRNGLDDPTLEKLWTRTIVGITPEMSEFRHIEPLKDSTEGILLHKKGSTIRGVYLDLANDSDVVNKEHLVYMIHKIFNHQPLTYAQKRDLISSLDKTQRDFGHKVFNASTPHFTVDIKMQIERIIEDSV